MNAPITWKNGTGEVVILPQRGRILEMNISGQKVLWSPVSSEVPWNLGGERIWVGPEADWFWKKTDAVDFKNYQVPSALNPDLWKVTESSAGQCKAELEISLVCAHKNSQVNLLLHRVFEFLPAACLSSNGVALRMTTAMKVISGTHGQSVDLWSILQVPIGGHMLMPTIGTPDVRDYFDPTPSTELIQSLGSLNLRIGGNTMFKIGVSPGQTTGRIAYARPIKEGMLILIRTFPVHPTARYCDTPLTALASQGDAAQFFNDGGHFGSFGEMEHRSHALVCVIGPQTCQESTETCAMLLPLQEFSTWKSQFLTEPESL